MPPLGYLQELGVAYQFYHFSINLMTFPDISAREEYLPGLNFIENPSIIDIISKLGYTPVMLNPTSLPPATNLTLSNVDYTRDIVEKGKLYSIWNNVYEAE